MARNTEQQKVPNNSSNEDRAKQIALNHFFSFYVCRDMQRVLQNVDNNVKFIGTKEFLVAHSKEELGILLSGEMDNVPPDCVVKVIMLESMTLTQDCCVVNGELELRIPYEMQIVYQVLRFSMTVLSDEMDCTITSIHTAISSDRQFKKIIGDAALINADGMNNRDVLTGVYTLDVFKVEMAEYMEKKSDNENYALLCTDVKHFERLNNLYGLMRADRLLVQLAKLLTGCSQTVKLCCRSVADHFILLVEYQKIGDLKLLLKNVCGKFDQEVAGEYTDAGPKLGFGVYLITDKEKNIGKMIECANTARKSIRMNRGLRVAFYDDSVFMRMEKVRKIEHSMKHAMDDGEFKVFFQPKYDLASGKIVGAEALCRWIREDGTMVYPDEFIPIFEKNGFIVDLDLYMLDEACGMLQKRLKNCKFCVPVSINQSRMLLSEDEYVEKIASVLAKYDTPSQYIELELTERIFKDNLTDIGQTMERLKDIGIRWSIDDFGTGYSSLNLLKELPVDIIKIDKSFLDETETSEVSKIIIRKTVELTQELNKMVVCEGVETESQADYLRDISCDIAQGYLYAKPMPMKDFEELLDKEMHKG